MTNTLANTTTPRGPASANIDGASARANQRAADTDIAVVGGGLAGLSTGLALAHAGHRVTIIDAAPRDVVLDYKFDGRATAIAYANFRMLEVLGVAGPLRDHACPIASIMVTDARLPRHHSMARRRFRAVDNGSGHSDGGHGARVGPCFLRFNADELPQTPGGATGEARQSARQSAPQSVPQSALGWMVENRRTRGVLLDAIDAHPNITHHAPVDVTDVHLGGDRPVITLADGRTLSAQLVVGADGRNSLVRRAMGVRQHGWSYGQHAIVATVQCAHDHHNIAHELFLPAGPFAILPLNDRRVSLVWTERTRPAGAAMALGEDAFVEQIRRRFGDFLGEIALEGPRWSYPLGLSLAESFIGPRAVLVGDAARRIHPIAGQGFNLGLKDAAMLAEVTANAARAGLDIGAADVLGRYNQARRFDSALLSLATDGFNRLFSNDLPPVRAARGMGMALVNAVPALRKALARNAGADLGDIPKLLKGENV